MDTGNHTFTRGTKRRLGHTSSQQGIAEAHERGFKDSFRGVKRNPYPKGYRRDAYDQAYAKSDPLGEHNGQNE